MTITTRLFLLLSVLLVTSSSLFAKAWHGIEPLQSTRSDVIRVLNQCSDQKEACVFTLDNEDVYILFSGGLSQKYSDCTERLPPETVMFIESRQHSGAAFQDFQFAKREFTESSLVGSWRTKRPVRYHLYANSKDGLALKAREGKVVQVVYLPSSSEVRRCPDYYDPLESFIELWSGHVPTVAVVCSQATVFERQEITVEAHTDIPSRTGYKWRVTNGRIVAGQYTPRIRIDTTGLAGKSIKALVEVNDRDLGVIVWSECSIAVSKRP
jgi:hypothetical protein